MTAYEIPLEPTPHTFAVTLAGVEYRLTVKWNERASCWVLDIATSLGAALVTGVPLVTGVDLLEQHRHLGIGGSLYAQTDDDPNAVPTFDNLGSNGHLFFVVP